VQIKQIKCSRPSLKRREGGDVQNRRVKEHNAEHNADHLHNISHVIEIYATFQSASINSPVLVFICNVPILT
jgi:hypothetical protein